MKILQQIFENMCKYVCLCLRVKRGKKLSGILYKKIHPLYCPKLNFIISYLPPFSSCHRLWQLLYTSSSDNSSINPPTFTCSVKITQTSHSATLFITAKPSRIHPRTEKVDILNENDCVTSSVLTLR